MIFNEHLGIQGKHAFLSPSNYHWTNYDEIKLRSRWFASMAAVKGIELHAFAHEAIRLRIKLPRNKKAFNAYVNDAIGYDMAVEQPLYYSENCFGHPDTIKFSHGFLRIHDLKTGIIPAKMRQLEVYAALFCLEYGYSPFEIDTELRIYQREEIMVEEAVPEYLYGLMERIVEFDKRIEEYKQEGR